jgi:hypothetical protein
MPVPCWVRLEPEKVVRIARADGSRVSFSTPDGRAWRFEDWVVVREPIDALIPQNGRLVARGRRADYVFYGVTTDSTGRSVFNYVVRPRGWRHRVARWLTKDRQGRQDGQDRP